MHTKTGAYLTNTLQRTLFEMKEVTTTKVDGDVSISPESPKRTPQQSDLWQRKRSPLDRIASAKRSVAASAVTSPKQVLVPLGLFAIGVASLWLYFWGRDLHRFTQWIAAFIYLFIGQLGLYVCACLVVLRGSRYLGGRAKFTLIAFIFVFAALYRAVLVPQRPYLSADVYRYVWDGHLQTEGINPYRYVPADPQLDAVRDESIYPNINGEDKSWHSPYPPAAQAVFLLISIVRPMSVTSFKAAMSLFDLITVMLLMFALARSGIDPARAILFAWHPLAIFEGAHSGHLESSFMMFLAFALLAWSARQRALTGIALSLAALVKFYPALLLPAFFSSVNDNPPNNKSASENPVSDNLRHESASINRSGTDPASNNPTIDEPPATRPVSIAAQLLRKQDWILVSSFVITILIGYACYTRSGINPFAFLGGYVQEEGFIQTGSRYFLLDALRTVFPIPTIVFLIIASLCLVGFIAIKLIRPKLSTTDVAISAAAIVGSYLMVTTPRYAWYYVWLIPFLCFSPRVGWLYLSCASVLLYLVWYTPFVYPEVPLWIGASIYLPTIGWFIWDRFRRKNSSVFEDHAVSG